MVNELTSGGVVSLRIEEALREDRSAPPRGQVRVEIRIAQRHPIAVQRHPAAIPGRLILVNVGIGERRVRAVNPESRQEDRARSPSLVVGERGALDIEIRALFLVERASEVVRYIEEKMAIQDGGRIAARLLAIRTIVPREEHAVQQRRLSRGIEDHALVEADAGPEVIVRDRRLDDPERPHRPDGPRVVHEYRVRTDGERPLREDGRLRARVSVDGPALEGERASLDVDRRTVAVDQRVLAKVAISHDGRSAPLHDASARRAVVARVVVNGRSLDGQVAVVHDPRPLAGLAVVSNLHRPERRSSRVA